MPESPELHLRPPNRVDWIDAAKAIAIVGVVGLHVVRWSSSLGLRSDAADVLTGMASPLPVFFLVSGLVGGRLLAVANVGTVIRRRIVPLLWIFLIWQPVVFGYKLLAAGSLSDQEDTSFGAHLLRLIISPIRPNGELWFLWALALYSVVTPFVLRLPVWPRVALAVTVAVVWTEVAHGLVSDAGYRLLGPGWQDLGTFYLFFILGVSFRDPIVRFVESLTWPRVIAVVSLWQGGFWGLSVFGSPEGVAASIATREAGLAVALLGCCAVLALARCLARVAWILAIGRATLPIFLTHTTVAVLLVCAVSVIVPAEKLHPSEAGAMLAMAILLVAVVAISFIAGRALERGPTRVLFAPPARAGSPVVDEGRRAR